MRYLKAAVAGTITRHLYLYQPVDVPVLYLVLLVTHCLVRTYLMYLPYYQVPVVSTYLPTLPT